MALVTQATKAAQPPVPDSASPSRWRAFLRARFTREGAVGLYLTVGFLACAVLVVLFGFLADEVFGVHGSTALDRQITAAIEHVHTPARDRVALTMTRLGSHEILIPATLLLTGALLWRKHRVSAVLFAGSVLGGWLLETLLKIIFHRARPDLWQALVSEKTFSFPSGHATMASLFYGGAAAVVLHNWKRPSVRRAALAAATVVIFGVSYSRVYLGAHWASDVAAGVVVGLFWVTVCATGTEYLARRTRKTDGV